jgi:KaiC/GvpD/RAD55 family RecA-like ATPase
MRVSTGVRGFDELVDGGLPENRLYIVSGPPGSGKTTFCAQFITEGARQGESCAYVTMHETEQEIVQDLSTFDFGFEQAATSGNLEFLNLVTEEGKRTLMHYGQDKGLSNRLVALIEQRNVSRVVIDSTMLLQHFTDDPAKEITQFISMLKQTDATILLISEMTDPTSYSEEHYLAHGVVFFHNFLDGGGMTRAVQIIKMRGTAIDCDMSAIEFSDGGLTVHPDEKVKG